MNACIELSSCGRRPFLFVNDYLLFPFSDDENAQTMVFLLSLYFLDPGQTFLEMIVVDLVLLYAPDYWCVRRHRLNIIISHCFLLTQR